MAGADNIADPNLRTISPKTAVDVNASPVLLNCQSWRDLQLAIASPDAEGRTFALPVASFPFSKKNDKLFRHPQLQRAELRRD
jgi:hypothetical protein